MVCGDGSVCHDTWTLVAGYEGAHVRTAVDCGPWRTAVLFGCPVFVCLS